MTDETRPWREIADGFRDLLPAVVAGIPIGLVYGALASSAGMSVMEVALMSALVFAGSAQFAALELWGQPVPVAAILLSTLLLNARMVLMSASLAPKTQSFAPWQRWLSFFALADENWAFAERRAARGHLSAAYFLAMCALFYVNWIVFTVAGALVGPLLGDPARFGGDFIFTALFIGIIAGFWRGPSTGVVIAASAGASALAWITLGAPWHVPAGAAAGIAAAAIAPSKARLA